MKLYHLWRLTPDEWDVAWEFLVRAESEDAARRAAAASDTGNVDWPENKETNRWLSPVFSACVEVSADGEEGIIIESRTST